MRALRLATLAALTLLILCAVPLLAQNPHNPGIFAEVHSSAVGDVAVFCLRSRKARVAAFAESSGAFDPCPFPSGRCW